MTVYLGFHVAWIRGLALSVRVRDVQVCVALRPFLWTAGATGDTALSTWERWNVWLGPLYADLTNWTPDVWKR